MTENRAIFLLVITTFFWGSTFPFTKALTQELSVLFILAYRFLGTAVILFVLSYKEWQRIAWPQKIWFKIIALGLVNLCAIYLQTLGLTTVSSANAGFVTALSVLFVPILDSVIRKNPVQRIVRWSLPISLAGIYLMSYGFDLPRIWNMGDFWVFLSAWCYAIYILLVDELAPHVPANLLMTIVFFITAAASIIFFLIWESRLFWDHLSALHNWSTNFLMWFLILGGTVLPYTFMVRGQKYVPAQQAALIYLLEPLFATLLATVFFREDLFLHTVSGAFLIVVSLIWVILGRKKA